MTVLERAKSGDIVAVEQLLTAHRAVVLTYAERHIPLNVRGILSAEDVCQDVLLEAFRRLGSFEETQDDSIRRWLLTIARRRIVTFVEAQYAEKRDRRRTHHVDAGDGSVVALLEELAVYERTPRQSAVRREVIMVVQEALDRLPEDYGAAIRLRYIEGVSVTDAAERMHRSGGALMTMCCRALRMLRTEMCLALSIAS
jgi:RNA polymerase sigma-70 factor, ECF subfamily